MLRLLLAVAILAAPSAHATDARPASPPVQQDWQKPTATEKTISTAVVLVMLGCPSIGVLAAIVLVARWLVGRTPGRGAATLLQQTPQQNLADAMDRIAFQKLLDRLMVSRGPAERKAVLARAQHEILTPEVRLELMLEASRLDAEQVLDRTGDMVSADARIRRLKAVLEQLENDGVPDDMQRDQIRLLQEALLKAHGDWRWSRRR